jgi:hypothetical protein
MAQDCNAESNVHLKVQINDSRLNSCSRAKILNANKHPRLKSEFQIDAEALA